MVEAARLARALLALAAPALAGCVSFEWRRQLADRPPEAEALAGLEAGATDLEDVLARFGAPLRVVELEGGMALAYGWLRAAEWGIGFSVPLGDASASFDYASADERVRGVMLFFDERWVLTSWHEGALTDLLLQPREASPIVPEPVLPPPRVP